VCLHADKLSVKVSAAKSLVDDSRCVCVCVCPAYERVFGGEGGVVLCMQDVCVCVGYNGRTHSHTHTHNYKHTQHTHTHKHKMHVQWARFNVGGHALLQAKAGLTCKHAWQVAADASRAASGCCTARA
jgi:hypothetical protein